MDGARNMNKYDTMLAVNKKRNKRKIDTAKKEIYKMLENGEKVTVTKLIEQTCIAVILPIVVIMMATIYSK